MSRYIVSAIFADDQVEFFPPGVTPPPVDGHRFTFPQTYEFPEFEANLGDSFTIRATDNWGDCRYVGPVILTHKPSGKFKELAPEFPGPRPGGCGNPAIPSSQPAVEFYNVPFPIEFPTPPPPGEGENDRNRRRCLEWLVAILRALGINADGCKIMEDALNLLAGVFPDLVLRYLSHNSADEAKSMGYGWSLNAYQRIEELTNGDLVLHDGSGSFERWRKEGSDYVAAYPDNYVTAAKVGADVVLTYPDTEVRTFEDPNHSFKKGRIRRREDRNGNALVYDYDDENEGGTGRLTDITDSWGRHIRFHFQSDGQPTQIADMRGVPPGSNESPPRRVELRYLPSGQLELVRNVAGDWTRFSYHPDGKLSKVARVRPEGDGFVDLAVDLVLKYVASGPHAGKVETETFAVDSAGKGQRKHTYTYEPGKITMVAEDLTEFASPARTLEVSFNERLSVTEVIQSVDSLEKNTWTFSYRDPLNPYLVTKVVDPNLVVTHYFYNAQGNLAEVLDNLSHRTRMRYYEDFEGGNKPRHRNLLYEVERPEVTVFEDGREVKRKYLATRLVYDDAGNVTAIIDSRQNQVSFGRNAAGQVTSVTDRNNHTTSLDHTPPHRGMLTSIRTPRTPAPTPGDPDKAPLLTTELRYHDVYFDQLEKVIDPGLRVTKFISDDAGRLTMVKGPMPPPPEDEDPDILATQFEYQDGLLAKVLAPPNQGSSNQARETAYVYDPLLTRLERVMSDVLRDGLVVPEMRARFEYDGFGQLRALVRKALGTERKTRYGYDRLGRHDSTTDPLDRVSTTTYEPYCASYTHRSARGAINTISFDTLCRLTTRENSAGKTKFRHDEWGRLTEVKKNGQSAASYGYDDIGRMLTRSDASEVAKFAWNGWSLLQEIAPDGVKTVYRAPGIEVFGIRRGNTEYQVQLDALGSMRRVTDANATVVTKADYSSWGGELSGGFDNLPGSMPARFVGGLGIRRDDSTGLHYMRDRWYDSQSGRFISRDRLRGGNPYAYVANTPTNSIDSRGLRTTVLITGTPAQDPTTGDPLTSPDGLQLYYGYVFDNGRLVQSFLITRDPYGEKDADTSQENRYLYGSEIPPGIYNAHPHPTRYNRINLSNIAGDDHTIKGQRSYDNVKYQRTYIQIHPYMSSIGCATMSQGGGGGNLYEFSPPDPTQRAQLTAYNSPFWTLSRWLGGDMGDDMPDVFVLSRYGQTNRAERDLSRGILASFLAATAPDDPFRPMPDMTLSAVVWHVAWRGLWPRHLWPAGSRLLPRP